MHRKLIAVLVLAICCGLAAACSSAPAPTQAPQPTVAPVTQAAPATEAAAATAEASTQPAQASGARIFVLDPSKTTAHFLVNEVLFGQPKLVDGATGKVEGQVSADYAHPSAVSVSPVKVDLTGLSTDSQQRNGMIQRSILETDNPANQFAVFTPAHCDGLPSTVTLGQPFSFKIAGSLALHGVTKDLTFDTTVTPVSASQLSGTASATIVYGDWGVQVLRLPPQVASVEDHVILKLDFVANAS